MIANDWTRRTVPENFPWATPSSKPYDFTPGVSQKDLDLLREEIKELRELLLAAKKYDEASGQPDCEDGDKIALIKRLAELVGVDLSDLFDE